MSAAAPLVTQIRRFALDDGPGIRTTVFFKGCPLACVWCHNPECIRREGETSFREERCIRCGACATGCPTGARTVLGTAYTVEALVELLLRDRVFFETSGGGVTLSGGEPTAHMEYAGRVLRELKRQGIHTAIQTCGCFEVAAFAEWILPYTDLIFFDLKLMDAREHLKFTGAANTGILENFRRLSALAHDRVVPRTPLVPGITATDANLSAIAGFLEGLGYGEWRKLEYNPGWAAKREALAKGRA